MTRQARRVPGVRQRDLTDCGPACLRAVAAFHGGAVSGARLRQLAGTRREGTSLRGLALAAERIGFEVRAVRAPAAALAALPVPLVAHLHRADGLLHYVVVEGTDADAVVVMDPEYGERTRQPRAAFDAIYTGHALLLQPGAGFESGRETSFARRMWGLAVPHRHALAQAVVGALLVAALGLGTSVFVQQIVDRILPEGDVPWLRLLALALAATAVLSVVLTWMRQQLVLRIAAVIDGTVVLGYLRRVLSLPPTFFASMRVGEIASRVGDAFRLRSFISESVSDLVVSVVSIAVAVGLLAVWSPAIALLVLGALPLYVVLFAVAMRLLRRLERERLASSAAFDAHLVEVLGNADAVRRFGVQAHVLEQLEDRLITALRVATRGGTVQAGIGAAAELLTKGLTLTVLVYGAFQSFRQVLTPGELVSSFSLLGYVTGPLGSLLGALGSVQEVRAATERLYEVAALPAEGDTDVVSSWEPPHWAVALEEVRFAYTGGTDVLRDVSLRFAPGRITALVGNSGCGKSTVGALLQRLYEPTAGRLTVDGATATTLDRALVRRRVVAVPQHTALFSGTVLANIALGDPRPDVDRILSLADRIGWRDALERLGGGAGLGTTVGEVGTALSGGQRQCIAILRALYTSPRVLILDEATSALDLLTERAVMRGIRELAAAGMTVVLIAHRLSAVASADTVYVLDEGRVIEHGSPRELLAAGGRLRELWDVHTSSVAVECGGHGAPVS